MAKQKKTSIYLEDIDLARIEQIKRSLGTTKNAVAVRFAIRNVPLSPSPSL